MSAASVTSVAAFLLLANQYVRLGATKGGIRDMRRYSDRLICEHVFNSISWDRCWLVNTRVVPLHDLEILRRHILVVEELRLVEASQDE